MKQRNNVQIIDVKTDVEIAAMREVSRMTAKILCHLAAMVKVDMSADVIDDEAKRLIAGYAGAQAAFFGYRGFPYSICVSRNEEVVHGFPVKNKVFRDGDLVSLDFGVRYKGYYGDAATTVALGDVKPQDKKLMEVTRRSLELAIEKVKPGATVGDLGSAVFTHVKDNGMDVVREFVGHGIGRSLHEDPAVPNWGSPGKGAKLIEGMTLAIEPMVAAGNGDVVIASDGWTARTKDKSMAAHFEHTVLVTDKGCEILTVIEEK
ncbi:MAG: type I methionyl aminopeptidase [Elusimicrobiota bacterium]